MHNSRRSAARPCLAITEIAGCLCTGVQGGNHLVPSAGITPRYQIYYHDGT